MERALEYIKRKRHDDEVVLKNEEEERRHKHKLQTDGRIDRALLPKPIENYRLPFVQTCSAV